MVTFKELKYPNRMVSENHCVLVLPQILQLVNLDSIRAASGREGPLMGLGQLCKREIAKTLQIENCKILILVQITNK